MSASRYPPWRAFEVIAGENENAVIPMKRLGWLLFRQGDVTTALCVLTAAITIGWWLWQGWRTGQWTPGAKVIIVTGAVILTTIALQNLRQSLELGALAGGWGVLLWLLGARIQPDIGGPMALALGVVMLVISAAHHEEVLSEPEPENPIRNVTIDTPEVNTGGME